MIKKLWSREELILAFNLYLKTPFGKMHSTNKEVIHLAHLIGRTPNSVALRLVNFASVDPVLKARGIKGMDGGKKVVQPIWDEFFNNQEELIFLSEEILAKKENSSIEGKFKELFWNIKELKGEVKLREIKTRVNQNVFRQIVMANYSGKCAISGIDLPELLFASHIVPWAKNEQERLNPENGICLSALYDKAFDKGLIGVNEQYQILLSEKIKKRKDKDYYGQYFALLENKSLILPQKYLPRKEFIQYHLDMVFEKA